MATTISARVWDPAIPNSNRTIEVVIPDATVATTVEALARMEALGFDPPPAMSEVADEPDPADGQDDDTEVEDDGPLAA